MMHQTESQRGKRIRDQATCHFFFPLDHNTAYLSEKIQVNKRRIQVIRLMKSRQIILAGIIVALLSSRDRRCTGKQFSNSTGSRYHFKYQYT